MTTNAGIALDGAQTASRRPLEFAAWAYLLGMTIHASDHLYRGMTGDSMNASWSDWLQDSLAGVAVLLPLAVLIFIRTGHRRSPLVAAVVGIGSALVFFSLHVLPSWGPFTDSFVDPMPGAQVNWYAWTTAALGIAGSLFLGIAGIARLRITKDPSSAADPGGADSKYA